MIQTADMGMKKPLQPVQTAKPQTPQGDPTIVPPGGITGAFGGGVQHAGTILGGVPGTILGKTGAGKAVGGAASGITGIFGGGGNLAEMAKHFLHNPSPTPTPAATGAQPPATGGGWGQTPGSTGATASMGMPSTYQSIPAAKPAGTYSPPSAPMMPSNTAPQIDSMHTQPTGGFVRGGQPTGGFTRGATPTGMSAAGGQPGGPPDLRGDVYAPTGNGQAGQNTDSLANRLVNYQFPQFNGVAGGSYTPGGDTSTARDMTMQQLKEAQAPDRAGLADSIFTRLEESSNPAFQANLRSVNQRNAAMGRGGSGMVNSELSDVASAREKDLANVRGQLADSAAGLSLSDRLAKLQATQGVFSDLSSNDRSNAGVNLDLRNEARGERTAGLNYGMDQFGAQAGLLGQLGGLEQNRFNQGVTGRNEMRTERGYQTDQAQQGIQNSVQQRMLEDQLLNNATNRQNQTVSTNAGVGYGGNPSSTYLAGADQLGGQAAAGSQSFSDLMANQSYLDWLRKQGGVLN